MLSRVKTGPRRLSAYNGHTQFVYRRPTLEISQYGFVNLG